MSVTFGANTVHPIPPRSPAAPTPSLFGSSSSPAPFGSPAPSSFGAPAPPATFGPPAPAPSFGFGSSPAPSTTFGSTTPAPSTSAFGSPAPSSGLFGSTPSSGGLFGSSTPAPFGAPSAGSLFGSKPSGGSLFGSSPAPSSGLFGSTPSSGGLFGSTPAPSTGLFGSTPTSGGLFGSTPASGGLFGSTPAAPQPVATSVVPEEAALKAHMDAAARQEESRVIGALTSIHQAYQGAYSVNKTSPQLVTILYNPIDQSQYPPALYPALYSDQHQANANLVALPIPAGVSKRDWERALIERPKGHVPAVFPGSVSLLARTTSQQTLANSLEQQIDQIKAALEALEPHDATARIAHMQYVQDALKERWHRILKKLEVARAYHLPWQEGETDALRHLRNLEYAVSRLKIKAPQAVQRVQDMPDETDLFHTIQGHRNWLQESNQQLKEAEKTVRLVKDRLASM